MRTLAALILAALTLPLALGAQDHDHGSMLGTVIPQNGTRGTVVHLQSGQETVDAELFFGMGKQRLTSPALVIIHEWWGLNDQVRDEARTFAAAGYTVLAVDLYRGKVASDPETAHELMRGLPHDRALRDLRSAVAYLHAHMPASGKVGVVGWCMGGGYAIDLAVADPGLNAVVVNYGSLPTDDAALSKINAPVLGNFGALDKGISPDMVAAFDKQMKALGKPVDIKEYPDTGHAFQNPNNKTGYNAADATDANRRTMLFLNAQLKR